MNLSDNVVHLIQLLLLVILACVILVFVPSVPPSTVLDLFAPAITLLIGLKVGVSATGGNTLVSALAANTSATQANTAASVSATPIAAVLPAAGGGPVSQMPTQAMPAIQGVLPPAA